jgi:hypothetical protein
MIVPETQRFMATRMKARVRSHQVDHTPLSLLPASSWKSFVMPSAKSPRC